MTIVIYRTREDLQSYCALPASLTVPPPPLPPCSTSNPDHQLHPPSCQRITPSPSASPLLSQTSASHVASHARQLVALWETSAGHVASHARKLVALLERSSQSHRGRKDAVEDRDLHFG